MDSTPHDDAGGAPDAAPPEADPHTAQGSGVPEAPPTALDQPTANNAFGAQAPQAEVVSMADAKRRKKRGAAIGGDSSSASPPPPDSAAARIEGKGGGSGDKPAKPQKKIDWGKFNFLLEHFALIYGTDTVWDGVNRMIMKIANLAHAHGSDMVKMWKANEKRRTIMLTAVVFDPTMRSDAKHTVNLFGGLEMEPKDMATEKDVAPMLDLIRFLTSRAGETVDESEEIMHYLLCWLAYPLQHPGTKLRTAVIMHGDEGTGKNILFETVLKIYGRYGALVGQDELEDKFNDWRSCKMFVAGDEVSSRQELVHNKNRLKSLVGSDTVQINPKNLPRREEKNHINIVFLSNELQPLALDNTDRRYLVIYTPRPHPFEYYRKLGEWRDTGGTEAFYRYLLDYPLEGFEPYAPAPLTRAKSDLIDLNRKSPERFWREWSSGELDLPYWSCAVAQAYQGYLKYAQRTGERFPFQRNLFTRMVLRMSETEGKPCREKVMKVGDTGNKTCERMLLVTDPPEGTPQGEWATGCVQAFEIELKKYLGFSPRSPGDGDPGQGDGS